MSYSFTATQITTIEPKAITKRFTLDNGRLIKSAAATVVAGRARQRTFADLEAFSRHLATLPSSDAFVYGIAPGFVDTLFYSDKEWQKRGKPADAITRTRRFFQYQRGAGVFMIDYDPPKGKADAALSREQLIKALHTAAPCLVDAPMLHRRSVSSGIVGTDGRVLSESHGQRVYIAVADATQIPEAGKALIDLLWAAGLGWVEIGAAGQALMRTIADATVWQPERIDFCAPPILGDGLERTAADDQIVGSSGLFDLRRLINLRDGAIRSAAADERKKAKNSKQDDLLEARAKWVDETAEQIAKTRDIPIDKIKATLARAADRHDLTGDFVLHCSDGAEVLVADLLDSPAKWHNRRFADPLEPTYTNDKRIAWANLRSGGRPYLYSHAHGGRRFYLIRPSARIELKTGERARIVDSTLDLLRERGELYDYGEGAALARITANAKVLPVTRDWFSDHLDRIAEFFAIKTKIDKEGNETTAEVPKDAPVWAAQRIIAKDAERALPRLEAAITAPILRADGSILSEPGYDETSRLVLISQTPDLPHIPLSPSLEQVRAALDRLWWPFRLFPTQDAVDRGVLLAAILTSVLRAVLQTAPGFAFDAPSAGTGKTLLAMTIAALGTGEAPAALPPASNSDADETRKRLFAALYGGAKVLLWDNVREPLGSAALDAFLTAPVFADRILQKSETAALPNRALFLATGNNIRLVGDTCRRILPARLDAQIEQPYARDFSFDPLQTVLSNRLALVADALTLVRGYIAAGRPKAAQGRTASFESWDDLVRQPIAWLASIGGLSCADHPLTFADPNKAIERAYSHDPETAKLGALLHSVAAMIHYRAQANRHHDTATIAEMINWASESHYDDDQGKAEARALLKEAMGEIADQRGSINPRILGRWIERHAERRIQGLRFVSCGTQKRAKRWAVVSEKTVGECSENNSPKLTNSPPSSQKTTATVYPERKKGELVSYSEFISEDRGKGFETEVVL